MCDRSRAVSSVVLQSAYYRVEVLPGDRIVCVVRLPRAFESAEAVEEACAPVQSALDRLGRERHSLLIDVRDAPLRNEPEYERWFADHRRRMPLGFRRAAVLVRTMAGKLQTNRLIENDKSGPVAFQDLREAVSYLEGGAEPPSRPTSHPPRLKGPRG